MGRKTSKIPFDKRRTKLDDVSNSWEEQLLKSLKSSKKLLVDKESQKA